MPATTIHAARVALICTFGALISVPASGGQHHTATSSLLSTGLEYGYNLDYPEALATFREAITANPDDATAHRLAAATVWMQLLFEQGAVIVEDYLGRARENVARKPPAPELAAAFREHLDRAVTLAERQLRDDPSNADAHFQAGAAAGLRALYIATIDGRVRDSVGAGRRAYNEQTGVLRLDPARKDAGLIVGLYRYAVSSLSFPMRLMARIAGFSSGRESGLRLVEDAASYRSYSQTSARFALILLYNREKRYDDAMRVIREMQQRYPRNRLLWLEAAGTALRAGRPREAIEALDEGLARLSGDSRPRAFGEEDRWHAQREAALAALRSHENRMERPRDRNATDSRRR